VGELDEISSRIGELTQGVKGLAKNQEKILDDLQEVKVSLAVHVEREEESEGWNTMINVNKGKSIYDDSPFFFPFKSDS